MSACWPRAPVARSTALSICALFLFLVCLSQICTLAEAKESSLFQRSRDGRIVAVTRSIASIISTPSDEAVYEILPNCTKITEGHSIRVECGHETFYEEEAKDKVGSAAFFRDVFLCIFFVMTSGLMSGLTLGLLGMDTNTLEILRRQGTEKEILYASRILPIVKRHHLLLVTLLLANAACMEALPLFLEHLMPDYLAIIVSVTAVLFIGEIIPQAILSRWALQIGGKIYWLVWGLMGLLFPIAWPISKILDYVLGHKSAVYYKRAQLKEFVSYHAASAFQNADGANPDRSGDEEAGEGSLSSSESDDGGLPKEERLTNDEVMIIKGALDLTNKNVTNSMTPLEKVFSLDESTIIDPRTLQSILDSGHSRIPLWRDDPSNFVGMLLVKSLNLNFILEGGILARADVKELPLVDASTPLYTMLNIFQTGRSHMAAVLVPGSTNRASGVITLEDIIEELIQEEIEDEMDLWRREHIRVRKTPSRRTSQNFSEAEIDVHRHRHRRSSRTSAMNRSKSGQWSEAEPSRRDRRDQQRRTRRGRELALGLESEDTGAESDYGPSLPSFSSDVETTPVSRRTVSPQQDKAASPSSSNIAIHHNRASSATSSSPSRTPNPDTDTEMVTLDL